MHITFKYEMFIYLLDTNKGGAKIHIAFGQFRNDCNRRAFYNKTMHTLETNKSYVSSRVLYFALPMVLDYLLGHFIQLSSFRTAEF